MIQLQRLAIVLAVSLMATASPAAERIDFSFEIRSILSEHCFQCHGPDAATREAELRLDTPDGIASVVAGGQFRRSELVRRILSTDPAERMPPSDSGRPLSTADKRLLLEWVKQGADYQAHWSFRPLQSNQPPRSGRSNWVRNDIDRFVLARLKASGRRPSAPAATSVLLRRIAFDLTGLPPTLERVDQILQSSSNEAVGQYVDELFDSSSYGEHMAVGWLEASRYADTDGYQNDRYRHHHVWRDWVIMAFQDNMPYDQFIIEQLGGDMLPNATLKNQIATGFCRNHRINSEDGSIPAEWHVENVADRVDTLGTVFLGLTIGCARCHDHKYDPISQREYYQLFAYFNNVPEWGVGPNDGNSPPFIKIPESWPVLSPQEAEFQIPQPLKLRQAREKDAGNGLKRPQAGNANTLMVMHELDEPRTTYLLTRGQYDLPDESDPLEPGVPAILQLPGTATPGNRLELARWLVDPANPLTARVAVNRLWQHFFGVGLVKTSENLGSQGELPSHPLLLDYLAEEFVSHGWDVRYIIKQIVMSATYQQTSSAPPADYEHDPENRLLARGPRLRLNGFALRDQALAVSGLLVHEFGGASVRPYMPPKIWRAFSNNSYKQGQGNDLYRRSIYTYWRRTIPPPMMMTFNAASREVCMVRTDKTNTPLQALTLLNHTIFIESARKMAERMIQEGGASLEKRVSYGCRLLLNRQPSEVELGLLTDVYQEMHSHFSEATDAASELLAVGESSVDSSIDSIDLAAMTLVANTLLNLDEATSRR